MKLKQLHAPHKSMHRVWQREERQQTGQRDADYWYQHYQLNAKPYRQSKTLGPKPEGYRESILPQA